MLFFFFFKQKTAYEMRISDWSSDVCSSDLYCGSLAASGQIVHALPREADPVRSPENAVIGRPDSRQEPHLSIVADLPAPPHHRAGCGVSGSWKISTNPIGRASCRDRGCQYV